jgi:hypothetical protein
MNGRNFRASPLPVAAVVGVMLIVLGGAQVQAKPQTARPHPPVANRSSSQHLLQQQQKKSAGHALQRAAAQQGWRNHLEQQKKSAQHQQRHPRARPTSGLAKLLKRGWHKLPF